MKQKLSYEVDVWRTEVLDAAKDVEQAIVSPLPRHKGETLLAYVKRTRRIVDIHLNRWTKANAAMHEAIKQAGAKS